MVPCEVDDGEGRGEVVISGIPVVSDGGPTVGCILTANYEGNKDALHNVHKLYSQVMSISACQHWTESELRELKTQSLTCQSKPAHL